MTRDRMYAIASLVLVIAALVAGFLMLGWPATQREKEADRRRVEDIQNLAREMHYRYRADQPLPESLSFAGRRASDPVTGTPYEYIRGQGTDYQVCATFQTDTSASNDRYLPERWRHPAGRHCWEFNATRLPE